MENLEKRTQQLKEKLSFYQRRYRESRGVNNEDYKYYYKSYISIKKQISELNTDK